MISADAAMVGSYDFRVVTLSVLVAMSASYVGLDLAERVTSTTGLVQSAWFKGGSTALGIGIWSMHFTGMLAFRLPVAVRYDWPTVALSFVIGTASSGVALYVVSRNKLSLDRAVMSSIAMGFGIAAMHYTGMAAMQMAAVIRFNPWIVILSVFLAIVNSLAGLWLAFYFRGMSKTIIWRKIGSGVVLGAAIWIMHYTGMAAASFIPSSGSEDLSRTMSISPLESTGISAVSLLVLGLAVWASSVDRKFHVTVHEIMFESLIETENRRRAEEEARRELEVNYRMLADYSLVGILRATKDGKILAANSVLARMLGYDSEAELLGANLASDVFENPAENERMMESCSKTDLIVDREAVWKMKDGRQLKVRLHGRAIRDKTGGVESFDVIVEDATGGS